ncbi:rhodanese domain-containing protein CG4456-like [Teleopsis dalmanni]|nr:rhodanese domain-containing protein CG4456-like isoform X2 [Teleopsis dalmanni]XP_037938625.1 rhodanese domain-containing protein CG4456-like [Teleopsis dalmanni]
MATYEEVKDIPNHPEKYLIDVRNRDEIANTGSIPGSINIPLPELQEALTGGDASFLETYGREKPAMDAVIIFTCQSGRRAANATAIATDLGYINSKSYPGSWLEWSQREGL